MKIKFVYGILPAFVCYKEVDGEVKNFASAWKIIIEPKYECDKGILQHELQHVRQWYRTGILFHAKRYKNSWEYRLDCEVEAYLIQMEYPKCDGTYLSLESAAEKLTWDRYRLYLTKEQALRYLKEKMED